MHGACILSITFCVYNDFSHFQCCFCLWVFCDLFQKQFSVSTSCWDSRQPGGQPPSLKQDDENVDQGWRVALLKEPPWSVCDALRGTVLPTLRAALRPARVVLTRDLSSTCEQVNDLLVGSQPGRPSSLWAASLAALLLCEQVSMLCMQPKLLYASAPRFSPPAQSNFPFKLLSGDIGATFCDVTTGLTLQPLFFKSSFNYWFLVIENWETIIEWLHRDSGARVFVRPSTLPCV